MLKYLLYLNTFLLYQYIIILYSLFYTKGVLKDHDGFIIINNNFFINYIKSILKLTKKNK